MKDLSEYQWKNRVILVAGADSSLVEKQKKIFETMGNENIDRDLKFIDQTDHIKGSNNQLPRFEVKLIGKDGTQKAEYKDPVEMKTFYKLIDAMPMRKVEMGNSR